MIDLNKTVVGEVQQQGGFTLLEEGRYTVTLSKITDWEIVTKGGATYAKATATLVETGTGARIIDTLLYDHPKVPWKFPNFVGAFLGAGSSLAPADIEKLVGMSCQVDLYIDEYVKEVEDKDTGRINTEKRQSNKVRGYFPLLEVSLDDMGI